MCVLCILLCNLVSTLQQTEYDSTVFFIIEQLVTQNVLCNPKSETNENEEKEKV